MVEYLAFRIMDGALAYDLVISKKPLLKEGIDKVLVRENRQDLINNK